MSATKPSAIARRSGSLLDGGGLSGTLESLGKASSSPSPGASAESDSPAGGSSANHSTGFAQSGTAIQSGVEQPASKTKMAAANAAGGHRTGSPVGRRVTLSPISRSSPIPFRREPALRPARRFARVIIVHCKMTFRRTIGSCYSTPANDVFPSTTPTSRTRALIPIVAASPLADLK